MSATKLIKETKLKSFIRHQYTALFHSTVFLVRGNRMISNDILQLRKKHKEREKYSCLIKSLCFIFFRWYNFAWTISIFCPI